MQYASPLGRLHLTLHLLLLLLLLLPHSSLLLLLAGQQPVGIDERYAEEAKEEDQEGRPARDELEKAGGIGEESGVVRGKVQHRRREGRGGGVVEDLEDVPPRLRSGVAVMVGRLGPICRRPLPLPILANAKIGGKFGIRRHEGVVCAVPAVEEEKAEDDRGGDGSEVEVGGGDGVDPVDEGCDDGGHLSGMALAFSSADYSGQFVQEQ